MQHNCDQEVKCRYVCYNLESCENESAVTKPRCAFLTTVWTCLLAEFKIKTSPWVVPLHVNQSEEMLSGQEDALKEFVHAQ